MLATNLFLLFALLVMVGIAIWLFRDGQGVGPAPLIRPLESDKDETKQPPGGRPQVRVVANDADPVRPKPPETGRDA